MNIEKPITEFFETQNTIGKMFKPWIESCEKLAAQAKKSETMISQLDRISVNTRPLQEALASLQIPNAVSQFASFQLPDIANQWANLQLSKIDTLHSLNNFTAEHSFDFARSNHEVSQFSIKFQENEELRLANLQGVLNWLRILCDAYNHRGEKTVAITVAYNNPQHLLWITKDTFVYFTDELLISEKLTNDKDIINIIADKCIKKMQEHGMEAFEVHTLGTGMLESVKVNAGVLKKMMIP